MLSQALKSITAEVLAAAKETPRLFFAPLLGAARGAYAETVRAYARRGLGPTRDEIKAFRKKG